MALAEYERLCRQRDALHPQPRLTDRVRDICQVWASNLLDAGFGIHEVAERLGHDPATLMRYYARVTATRRLQATNHIADLLTSSADRPGH
ncbi:hypothetical protein [Nucisporomicrobium flavum]|uniref:hypothetical protein n=1 Tax=Nucisporomicrobium flavum TaxID=2785915 RepID=UPI0018F4723B|nr:hypothetical protein [Nucisporomicrobium flavum]